MQNVNISTKEVINMAIQSGLGTGQQQYFTGAAADVERLVKNAMARQREECAKLCEALSGKTGPECAAVIRGAA